MLGIKSYKATKHRTEYQNSTVTLNIDISFNARHYYSSNIYQREEPISAFSNKLVEREVT